MTTYCSISDLDLLLEGFVANYYGTFLDDGEDMTLGTQYLIDVGASFDETNEWLQSISHIKTIPIGTQPTTGNFPLHVRLLQGNLMIYNRLKGKHYGEFTQGIPGWITTYIARAKEILTDIKGQNVVFESDVTQGEQGIGVGTFDSKNGIAAWYTNWQTGIYRRDDFPRNYKIVIDGTISGNGIGSATYKVSDDGGVTWIRNGLQTSTSWNDIGWGLMVRWAAASGTSNQLEYGDAFSLQCVPLNVPVKSGNMRYTTFKRG